MNKKINLFYALLLLAVTFSTHKTCAMEPNHQQMLFELCNAPVTPETLDQIESLCKEPDVNLNFFYPGIGGTVLMLAAAEDNCSLIQILLKSGANINATTPNGFTALMTAVHHANIDAVQCLLNDPKIKVNQQTTTVGNTALMIALYRRNKLITQGHITTDSVLRKNKLIIKKLLVAGANPDIANKRKVTPRLIVQEIGDPEIFQLMFIAND